jgi:hypothetical protein
MTFLHNWEVVPSKNILTQFSLKSRPFGDNLFIGIPSKILKERYVKILPLLESKRLTIFLS